MFGLLVITFSLTVGLTYLALMLIVMWAGLPWLGRIAIGSIVLVVAVVTAVLWIQLFFYLNDIGTSYVNYITVSI